MADDRLNTELFTAIEEGNLESIEKALIEGADINAKDNAGYAPLMQAINELPTASNDDEKYYKVIDLLLANQQLDINAYDTNKIEPKTALYLATLYLLPKAVEKLLNHENLSFVAIEQVLNEIKDQDRYLIIRELVKKEKYIDLMYAARNGNIAAVKELIEAKTDVNIHSKDDWTALMIAAQEGHTAIVEELITAGANVNVQSKDDWTALMVAAFDGHIDVIKKLIKAKANVNVQRKDGRTALMIAAQNGHVDVVKELIKAKASVNVQSKGGWTALTIAAQEGHTAIVEELIKAKANVNVQNNGKLSNLHANIRTIYRI
ncbi:MAG: hypothetical protein sL5_02260 [Candidatus Mesenet longicola]|uniref:Ankyrin repeat domain-containing protein n=1 Tax=Candidatus Mesenet longicola TaxID=1892558 RepID=A0A8J3HPD5_9RICK|nr:MAG: hypothetical protein sGL2_02250 [Candidatus Mesenet longicola]GHM59233.1 MAG: hypothetical protein sL5_02260 [Candidatus Mesenet longicola]